MPTRLYCLFAINSSKYVIACRNP